MDGFIIFGSDSKLSKAFTTVHPKTNILLSKANCNITNENSVEKYLRENDYKYVLNCAAITDIFFCETNYDDCFAVNVNGPQIIEKGCKIFDKKLIQISSDYATTPVNNYGKSKKLMEESLSQDSSLIVRTSFYSENYQPIRNLMEGKSVDGYTNIYFNPISSYTLAMEIVKNKDKVGLINIFSNKKISKYEFLVSFCDVFGINKKMVRKTLYQKGTNKPERPNSSFVKSDISIGLLNDLQIFKEYSHF